MITSGFLHGSWGHLLFNMLTLYFFGTVLELGDRSGEGVGEITYLLIYFLALIGGNLLALFMYRNDYEYRALGASGAVSGILFATILLFPGHDLLLFFVIPVPDWAFAVGYMGYSLYGMRTRRDNIGHEAHLGGAITGALAAVVVNPMILKEQTLLFCALVIPVVAFLLIYHYRPEWVGMGPLAGTRRRRGPRKVKQQAQEPTIRDYEAELDRLLDKVSKSGLESLSKQEKIRLDVLSKNLGNRGGGGGSGHRAP